MRFWASRPLLKVSATFVQSCVGFTPRALFEAPFPPSTDIWNELVGSNPSVFTQQLTR